MTTEGIAWASDLKKYKVSNRSLQWLDVTDPRFMNWMRIASLPDFRKLWARIPENLPAGQYSITIANSKPLPIQTMTLAPLALPSISCYRLPIYLALRICFYL